LGKNSDPLDMILKTKGKANNIETHLVGKATRYLNQFNKKTFLFSRLDITDLPQKNFNDTLSKNRKYRWKGVIKIVLIMVFAFFLISNVYSQSKIAVLIANQNYLYTSALRTPIAEIDTLEKICRANDYKTIVFKNVPLNNYNLIFDSLEKIIDQEAFVYIHYAGHGVQLDGENYIVPIDAHPNTIAQAERQCIQVNQFIKLINAYQYSHEIKSLVCIDACRDNPFKEIVGNINIGFRKIDYSPINTGIIYSCAAGKTALDGRKDYSPFAKVWIKQIQNCNLSINEISTMIDGELLKLGLSEDRLPERRFVGLSSVYFCGKDKVIDNRNQESKLALLNSLKDNMDLDFSNRNYTSVIGKSKWIDSLLVNNKELKKNVPSEDYLRIKYLESISFFEIDDLENSEKKFEYLWSLFNMKDDNLVVNAPNIQDDFFYDTYFYLGRIYSLQKKWQKIKKLRRQFLTYSKKNGNTLDMITTYDKIAGDFEGENQLDSARLYYNLSIKEAEDYQISNSYEAACITSFYNNKGKFHLWQNEPQLALQSLTKAYFIYKKHNLSAHYVLCDLADYYIINKITFNGDSAMRYLTEYKTATNLNTVIERLNFFKLDFDLNVQLKNQDSIKFKLELYFNEMNKLLNFAMVKNDIGVKKFDSLCEVPYWNLSFILPKNVYPIMFIDKNFNEEYENQDLILTPDFLNIKANTALEISSENKNEPNLVVYQDNFQIPNSGIVSLQRNITNDDFILTPKSRLINSTAEFHDVGENTEWNFIIYFSDIGINSKVNYYIGGMNLRCDNKYLIKHSKLITISPAKQGAKYIYKCLH